MKQVVPSYYLSENPLYLFKNTATARYFTIVQKYQATIYKFNFDKSIQVARYYNLFFCVGYIIKQLFHFGQTNFGHIY